MEVRNRFKGLDQMERVPDELWMEVHDIVQETGIKTLPMKKKCKKAKWLSEAALQIAVKRRKVKRKGKKERYIHLNEGFQVTFRSSIWNVGLPLRRCSGQGPHLSVDGPREEGCSMNIY